MNMSDESLGGWQEQLVTFSQKKRKGYRAASPEQAQISVRLRVRIVWVLALLLFAALVARSFYLQVFDSNQKLLLADNNHLEQVRLTAPRGKILDRNGLVLAESTMDNDHNFQRNYPLGKSAAMIVGYMSQVTEKELGCLEGLCYNPGMMIGRSGIEKALEATLRGTDGGMVEEVDAKGSVARERGRNEPEPGADVTLTIDSRLQKLMYEALEQARVKNQPVKGAAVALNMQGEVLGLVSYPTFDPTDVAKYLSDSTESYFLNRAVAGIYPPGSVFKLVTSYAGLTSGAITAETKIEDTGEIRVGDYRYGTWNFDQAGRTEGELDLVKAIKRSNDIYFYKVGEMVGVDKLVKEAKEFGLGQTTGIELPGESAGLVPDPLWKERQTGESWFLGNTYHLAIGQGDLLVTPIQVARMTLAAVTGRLCQTKIVNNGGGQCQDLGIESGMISTVREGMKEACSSGGTAYPLFGFEPYLICKTGTAQHAGQTSESDLPHAWVTVAYPGENPEMILTVLVEAGGEGSDTAAPIAKQILTGWKSRI